MSDKNVWVSPHEDGWSIKREGSKKPSNVYRTKKEAESRARDLAIKDGVERIF